MSLRHENTNLIVFRNEKKNVKIEGDRMSNPELNSHIRSQN